MKLTTLNNELTDLEGTKIMDAGKTVTLKKVIINALMGTYQDEDKLTGADKLKRYELGTKISAATESIDLASEEVTLIKTLIGKAYATLVVGQSYKMIEG